MIKLTLLIKSAILLLVILIVIITCGSLMGCKINESNHIINVKRHYDNGDVFALKIIPDSSEGIFNNEEIESKIVEVKYNNIRIFNNRVFFIAYTNNGDFKLEYLCEIEYYIFYLLDNKYLFIIDKRNVNNTRDHTLTKKFDKKIKIHIQVAREMCYFYSYDYYVYFAEYLIQQNDAWVKEDIRKKRDGILTHDEQLFYGQDVYKLILYAKDVSKKYNF